MTIPWLCLLISLWTVHEVNYLDRNSLFMLVELNVNTANSNVCHNNVYQAAYPYFWLMFSQLKDISYHGLRAVFLEPTK